MYGIQFLKLFHQFIHQQEYKTVLFRLIWQGIINLTSFDPGYDATHSKIIRQLNFLLNQRLMQRKILKSCSNIWSCCSSGAPNSETSFYHLMVAASETPNIGSNQLKIFNNVCATRWDLAVISTVKLRNWRSYIKNYRHCHPKSNVEIIEQNQISNKRHVVHMDSVVIWKVIDDSFFLLVLFVQRVKFLFG